MVSSAERERASLEQHPSGTKGGRKSGPAGNNHEQLLHAWTAGCRGRKRHIFTPELPLQLLNTLILSHRAALGPAPQTECYCTAWTLHTVFLAVLHPCTTQEVGQVLFALLEWAVSSANKPGM